MESLQFFCLHIILVFTTSFFQFIVRNEWQKVTFKLVRLWAATLHSFLSVFFSMSPMNRVLWFLRTWGATIVYSTYTAKPIELKFPGNILINSKMALFRQENIRVYTAVRWQTERIGQLVVFNLLLCRSTIAHSVWGSVPPLVRPSINFEKPLQL